MARIVIWIVGLALLSIIYVAAIHFKADDIEYDLMARSNLALVKNDISWANITINGRDAILNGIAPDTESIEKAKKAIMSVRGIRVVECRCKISKETSLSEENKKPATSPQVQPIISSNPVSLVAYQDNINESVINKEIEKKAAEPEKENYDSTDQCQENFNVLLKEHSIEFTSGSSAISNESFSLLEKLMTITQNCPRKRIKIAGHTDNIGNTDKNRILSLDRAEAVLNYFQKEGVPVDRFKAIGYGDSSPVVSNDSEEGRKRNRRIEFHVTP